MNPPILKNKSFLLVSLSFTILMDMSNSFELNMTSIKRTTRETDFCEFNEAPTKTGDGSMELLYHPRTRKCFRFGTLGPCGENMIFYNNPFRPKLGFCDCDQGFRSEYPCSDHPVRRMIFIPRMGKCFPIFSQGPCLTGYWLNLEETTQKPICEWNPCLQKFTQATDDSLNQRDEDYRKNILRNEHPNKFLFYDPVRKSCYKTQTRGYCPVGLTLELTHDSIVPKCRRKLCYAKLTNFRSFLTCLPGSRYSFLLKGCVKRVSRPRNYYIFG